MTTEIWTKSQASIQDRRAVEAGVPFLSLMEVAGAKAAQYIRQRFNQSINRVVVLVGKGANGGDGLVLARHLAPYYAVVVKMLDGEPGFYGARAMVDAAQKFGAAIQTGWSGTLDADLVVDGVFGTGFHGTLDHKAMLDIYQIIAHRGIPLIALDMLSGVAANSGAYMGPPTKALATIAFGASKWAHWGYPGAAMRGDLIVADIGLGLFNEAVDHWLDPALATQWLPSLNVLGHKYSRGRVVVIGGSAGMGGAPVLAGMAALRSGAGLVTLIVPRTVASRVKVPSTLLVHEAPAAHGSLRWSDKESAACARADAIVFGPGVGGAVLPEVLEVIAALGKPMVVDADGLRLLAKMPRLIFLAPLVITPHSGEAAALLGRADIDDDRPAATRELMQRYHARVILKGAYSIVGDVDQLRVNPVGTKEMATPGSGDVLAGMVGSLMAQGMEAGMAASLGAYWHGWAGLVGSEKYGESLIATDIIDSIATARVRVHQGVRPPGAPIDM